MSYSNQPPVWRWSIFTHQQLNHLIILLINPGMSHLESYINHQLNSSPTKEAHVFPKSKRFQHTNRLATEAVYTIPSTVSQRCTSFGIGEKISLADKKVLPPPGSYRLSSDFQRNQYRNVTSIGVGRDQATFGSFLLEALKRNRDLPSPDKYDAHEKRSVPGGHMGDRIKTDMNLKQKRSIPGPGSYKLTAVELSKNGNYILSNYKSTRSPKYFSTVALNRGQNCSNNKHKSVFYEVQQKQIGRYSNSKYKNIATRSFGKAQRPGLEDKSKIHFPGFKYRRFSDFGNFD